MCGTPKPRLRSSGRLSEGHCGALKVSEQERGRLFAVGVSGVRLEMLLWTPLLLHLFTWQVFAEHLLCTRPQAEEVPALRWWGSKCEPTSHKVKG